jgi:hypothetical protein
MNILVQNRAMIFVSHHCTFSGWTVRIIPTFTDTLHLYRKVLIDSDQTKQAGIVLSSGYSNLSIWWSVWDCRIKEQLLTEQASAVYIFNEDSRSFLQTATKSGSTFTFLKALLILPQEQTSTVVPPSVSSTTGFLSTKPSEPVIVRLSTLVRPFCPGHLYPLSLPI